jgi:hypothetical protein
MSLRKSAIALATCLVLASTGQAAISVPKLVGIQVDGKGDDWQDRGAKVDVLLPDEGKPFPVTEFDANFRLAWDERGLLLLVNVKDAVATEAEALPGLWRADSLELFLSDKVGAPPVQFMIAPGTDGKHLEPRYHVNDRRSATAGKEAAAAKPVHTVARTRIDGGYTLEAVVPWTAMNRQAKAGDTLAFQFFANSNDEGVGPRKLVFFPLRGNYQSPDLMHELLLSNSAASHVQALADAQCERFRRVNVELLSSPAIVGKSATVKLFSAGKPDGAIVR